MTYNESFIINKYFNRTKTIDNDIKIGIGDDCALINVCDKQMLAISTDTLVCGRHFLHDINPNDLAYKALAVSISDLAAMGADPKWLTLAITLPKIDTKWLKTFSDSLFEQLNIHNMQLIGGDTTSGPLSITLSVYGFIPHGKALQRSGAKLDDWIYVTGTLGDSAAGLAILQNRLLIENTNDAKYLIKRHLRPTPRLFQGKILRDYASAAIDLSDGLVSDLKHILHASNVGAHIKIDMCPLSSPMRQHISSEQSLKWALCGGEDYELCFTISENNRSILCAMLNQFNVPLTCIGKIITEKEGLKFTLEGSVVKPSLENFIHFK